MEVMNLNAEVKNVGSGVLIVLYHEGKKVYTHLVTVEMLEKQNGQDEEDAKNDAGSETGL